MPGQEEDAMRNDTISGPTFGGGHDLYVSSDANAVGDSLQYGDYSYEDAGLGRHFFTGDVNFQVAEYEVFAIAHV
jgi:hypothetical protein